MDKLGEMGEIFVANDGRYILRAKAKQFPRKTALSLLRIAWNRKPASITYFWDKEQALLLSLMKKLYGTLAWSTTVSEAYQVYMAVSATNKVPGELAEIGVYQGGTSKIIATAKEDAKELHLFDTFGEGLPTPGKHDDSFWQKGSFKLAENEFEAIKKRLADKRNIYFHQGIFPATAGPIENKRFSFVNLDVDIYQSTIDCLNFFYPRMNKGAVIMTHDYRGALGVKKAFDEFFADKPEPVIGLSTSQAMVVKI